MKKQFLLVLRQLRARAMRFLKPTKGYWFATKRLKPLSTKSGFDRGTPIDRFWIEKFIGGNKRYIRGRCLEIGDNRYTKRFGEGRVTHSDILDINKKNKDATIYADLRYMPKVKSNTFDCIILTHVLGMIDDINSAIKECHRILKPGGTILATSACFSPTYDVYSSYWRFTVAGMEYLFTKCFNPKQVSVRSYGNVVTGQYFWVGLSQEELTQKELDYDDSRFPCIVAVSATKK